MTHLAARLLLVASLAWGAAACRQSTPAVAPARGSAAAEPADEPGDLAAALTGAVLELYGHLGLGNSGAYFDALATDQSIALIGVTADSVVVGRSPRSATRDRRVFRALGPELLAKNLEVTLSEDGSVGWVYDEMSYRVSFEERIASIPIRQTSIWVRDFDRWVEVVEHWSYAVPVADLRRLAAARKLPAPRAFASQQRIAPAREIVRLVGRLHNASGDRSGMFVAGDRALVLMPDAEYRGADVLRAPSLGQLFGDAATVGLRDYRLGLAKNGELAWMVANLVVRTTVNDDAVEIGLRGTYLLGSSPEGWRVIQLHISAPVTTAELSRRVFGI
jgi:hypothetical protein